MQFVLFGLMVLARQALEFFVSVPPTGVLFIDSTTVLHAAVFYGTFFVALALCVGHFAGWKQQEALRRVFALSPLLVAAPLIDWVFFGRYGVSMSYHFVGIVDFAEHFLSYFGPITQGGVTFGMRLQVLGIILLFGMWVYRAKKSIGHALVAMLATYGLIYLMASAPSYIGWIESVRIGEWHTDTAWVVFSAVNQSVARIHDWGIGEAITVLRFNMNMAQLWFSVFSVMLAWKCRGAIQTMYTKSRTLRAGLYIALCAVGAALAPSYLVHIDIEITVATVITVIAAAITIGSAWTYAFAVNDVHDIASDEIVHKDRALPRGMLKQEHMIAMAKNAGLLAILGSVTLSQIAFCAISFFLFCATVYSVPPLQARRFFAIPQFIMAMASLAIFYLGFDLMAKDPISWEMMRVMISLGFLLFGFWFFKDIDDMEGDQHAGYDTVMTWFGASLGPIVAYGIFIVTSIIPLILMRSIPLVGIFTVLHVLLYALIQRGRLSEVFLPIFLIFYMAALVVVGV